MGSSSELKARLSVELFLARLDLCALIRLFTWKVANFFIVSLYFFRNSSNFSFKSKYSFSFFYL